MTNKLVPEPGSADVCIIGPDRSLPVAGGVVTHMRTLGSLRIFSDATFLPLGSFRGGARMPLLSVLRQLINISRAVSSCRFVFVNASIDRLSLLKLCLLLALVRLSRLPAPSVLVFFHGGSFAAHRKQWPTSILLRLLARHTTLFLFLSEEQLEDFKLSVGAFPSALYRNFSLHDLPVRRAVRGKAIRLLFVGRLTQPKGVFDILDAYRRLSVTHPGEFELCYVGQGDADVSLRTIAADHKLCSVEFAGYQSGADLDAQYARADLVLLPSSHAEGFPYVFIEAMRAGVPLVATPVGALKRLIRPDFNGYFVPAGDPGALMETILSYSSLPSHKKAEMQKACCDYFSTSLSRGAAENYYQALLTELRRSQAIGPKPEPDL